MRASRLLSLLMLLQSRGRQPAEALAAELEVSVRTIYRDIDELSAAGVPVWAERGRSGGFVLQPGWRSQVDGLTAPEAQALFLGGLPGPAAQLGLGEAMASAQLKLLAALPADWRENAQRVGARFHLDPMDWFRGPDAADHLPAVAHAVWECERIDVRYESWRGESTRRLEPLGLVLKAGYWYLAARRAGEAEARTYRLSSIRALEATGERFERPGAFDLAAYWRASTERFEAGRFSGEATLCVSARGLERLREWGGAVAEALRGAVPHAGRRGWRRVTVPIESVEFAARQMLRLGPEGEVLAPPELRRAVARTVRAMAGLYGPAARGKAPMKRRESLAP